MSKPYFDKLLVIPMKNDRKVQSYDILQYESEASYVKTIF